MTFRGTLFEVTQPESSKPSDIFCRSDLVLHDRVACGLQPKAEIFPLPHLPFGSPSHYTAFL